MLNKKVILVEDDDLIRDLYKRQLDQAGFTTEPYPNGNSALEALAKSPYDLAILDIMLPDVNGLEILKRIKSDPQTKNTPVVLLTNLGQDEVVKEGFALGADGYLIKLYYTPEQVIKELKSILNIA